MLVLTRKTDQSIWIGDPKSDEEPIEVTVTEIQGDSVSLGITAPNDVAVDRTEIWLDVQQNGRREEKQVRKQEFHVEVFEGKIQKNF